MNSQKNDNLYYDRFSQLMSWINSATITFLIGGFLSLGIFFYIHWIFGVVFGFLTLIVSIASYIVFKK
jgi:hypothetical protein